MPIRRRLPAEILLYAGLGAAALPVGFMIGAVIGAFGTPVPLLFVGLTGAAGAFTLASALLEEVDALPEPGGE